MRDSDGDRTASLNLEVLDSLKHTDLYHGYREQFYSEIAEAARNEWASHPELACFKYSGRGFVIGMQSWGDTIPWNFVYQIANRLWMSAAAGLPYLFDLAYRSPDGRIVVTISLRLAFEALAESVGSSSSSTTTRWSYDENGLPGDNLSGNHNWREGSVESVNSGQPLHATGT